MLDANLFKDLQKIYYEVRSLTLNSNLTISDVMLTEMFSDMVMMM